MEALIRAGADFRHVNAYGELPHEIIDEQDFCGEHPLAGVRLALTSCVWYETLRRCGIHSTGDVSFRDIFELNHRKWASRYRYSKRQAFPLDSIFSQKWAFEDRLVAVLEDWTPTLEETATPSLSSSFRATRIHWANKFVKNLLSELRSRKMSHSISREREIYQDMTHASEGSTSHDHSSKPHLSVGCDQSEENGNIEVECETDSEEIYFSAENDW